MSAVSGVWVVTTQYVRQFPVFHGLGDFVIFRNINASKISSNTIENTISMKSKVLAVPKAQHPGTKKRKRLGTLILANLHS